MTALSVELFINIVSEFFREILLFVPLVGEQTKLLSRDKVVFL